MGKRKKLCACCEEKEPRQEWMICDECRRLIGWPTEAQIKRGVNVESKGTGLVQDGVKPCEIRLRAIRDDMERDTIAVKWRPARSKKWRRLGTTLDARYHELDPGQAIAINAWLQGLAEEVEPLLEEEEEEEEE